MINLIFNKNKILKIKRLLLKKRFFHNKIKMMKIKNTFCCFHSSLQLQKQCSLLLSWVIHSDSYFFSKIPWNIQHFALALTSVMTSAQSHTCTAVHRLLQHHSAGSSTADWPSCQPQSCNSLLRVLQTCQRHCDQTVTITHSHHSMRYHRVPKCSPYGKRACACTQRPGLPQACGCG